MEFTYLLAQGHLPILSDWYLQEHCPLYESWEQTCLEEAFLNHKY